MTATLLGPLPDGVVSVVSTLANWLVLLCVAPLLWATLHYEKHDQRRAHPSPVTWGIWFLVGMVATVGLALGGAPTSAWTIKLFLSLGPVIVAVVALCCGEKLIATRVDKWSLILGGIGLVLYILVYFGAIESALVYLGVAGPVLAYFGADPYMAGLVAVGTAIAVDAIGAGPTWVNGWRNGAPQAEIVTFALALISVIAVLCILPWPWTWLSATYLVFLGLQMVSIIAVDYAGRRRTQHAPPLAEAVDW